MTLIIVRKCNADHNDQRHDIKDNHTQNRKRQQRKMELIIQHLIAVFLKCIDMLSRFSAKL